MEGGRGSFYQVQYDDHRTGGRAHLFAAEDGTFQFWAVTPTPYPIPDDGLVGRMLSMTGRSPMRAIHLHVRVAGRRHADTGHPHVRRGDDSLATDSVFGVKDPLVKDFVVQPAGTPAPDGRDLGDRSWSRTRFDIVLAPAHA